MPMEERQSLVKQRAPRRFEDMRGQEKAVKLLSGFVQRKLGYSILLHGAYGSGKTTLAPIYARALNCANPSAMGSPCGSEGCPCHNIESYFFEFDVPSFREGEDIIALTGMRLAVMAPHAKRVLFFDEAHKLSRHDQNALLKSVETEKVTYVLATTQPWDIIAPLRSRLQPIEVQSLTLDASVKFLSEAASDLGLSAEHAALSLVASVARGHPRDLLAALDRAIDWGTSPIPPLVAAEVRTRLDISSDEHLIRYFRRLTDRSGHPAAQVLHSWPLDWPSKARWVQCLLLALLLRIQKQPAFIDPMIDVIDLNIQDELLDAFAAYWDLQTHSDLTTCLTEMIAAWGSPLDPSSDLEARIKFVIFEQSVTAPRSLQSRATDLGALLPRDVHEEPSLFMDDDTFASETGYITVDQARELINRVSALVQEYDRMINIKLLYFPPSSIRDDEKQAIDNIDAFVRSLLDFDNPSGSPQAAVTIIERDEDGIFARVIAHLVSPEIRIGFADVLRAWFRDSGWTIESFKICTHKKKPLAIDFQWGAVSDLLAPLHDLKYPPRDLLRQLNVSFGHTGGPIHPPHSIIRYYGAIEYKPLLDAQRFGLTFLTLASDDMWENVTGGWERDAFEKRNNERSQREERAKAALDHLPKESSQFQEELKQLRKSWARTPIDRSEHA